MDRHNIYSSREHFNREQRSLFRRNWTCAGFGHQIPKEGDIAPTTVGGLPLIMVRGAGGDIRVFHNVCRHRGSTIVDAPCSGRTLIRCPYHSWTYGLDGRLRQRPHFDGPDKHSSAGAGLWRAKSGVWADAVFVDIDGCAGDFETFIAPLRALGEIYGIADAVHDGTVDIEIDANWKLLVENFVDGYHISSVHPELEQSAPTRLHTFRRDGPLFIGTAPCRTGSTGPYVSGLPAFADVDESVAGALTYISVFPNFCVNMTPDRLSFYLMQPVAADRSLERIHNYYASAAFEPGLRELRQSMTRNQLAFNAEDIDALIRLQTGRSSDVYDGGTPSPFWDSNAESFLDMCRTSTG